MQTKNVLCKKKKKKKKEVFSDLVYHYGNNLS